MQRMIVKDKEGRRTSNNFIQDIMTDSCVSTRVSSCRRPAAGFRMDNPSKIARGGDRPWFEAVS